MTRALLLACVLTASACTQAPVTGVGVSGTTVKIVDLGGVVKLPSALLPEVASAQAAEVNPPAAKWGLLTLGEEVPLPNAVVYLTDPLDRFYRAAGKLVQVTTDAQGEYRFQGGVPKNVPVLVNAVVSGSRRLLAFAVPGSQPRTVNLDVMTTYVTEYLRQQAADDQKALTTYDLAQLDGLATKSKLFLQADELPLPDLELAHLADMDRAYALCVGTHKELGDAWVRLLGRRILALQVVAGTGNASAVGDGGPATDAELYKPRDLALDALGFLFIADEGNNVIRRVDPKTHGIITFAGTGRAGFGGDNGPATQALLNTPRAVVVDAAGNVYIADPLNARIRRVESGTGTITTIAGNPKPDGAGGWIADQSGDGGPATLAHLFKPGCMAFDSAGNLFFVDGAADTTFHTIREIDAKSGAITTVVGLPGKAGAFDGDGGSPKGARLNAPGQLAFDPQGRLLIADTGNHCIRRVDFKADTITTVAGVGGQSGSDADGTPAPRAHLDAPVGLAVTRDGRLFISARGAGKILTVGTDGLMRALAGGGSEKGEGDARRIQLLAPYGLTVDAAGDLLLADARAARVRKLVLHFGL